MIPRTSMQYEMRLNQHAFNKIKDGSKTIEVRLNDERRRLLKPGDHIRFANRDNEAESINIEIVDLYATETFDELFDLFPAEDFGGSDKVELLNNIYTHYSYENEQKYGVLGIKIKLLL